MKRFFLYILALLFVSQNIEAKVVTDMANRHVVLPDSIDRVYASAPPMMLLTYLLAPEKLIASSYKSSVMSKKTIYMDSYYLQLTPVGGWHGGVNGANMEALLHLKPQIALAWNNSFVMKNAEETLKKFNIPTFFIQEDSVEDEPNAIRFTGKVLGVEKKSEMIAADAEKRLSYVKKIVNTIPLEKRLKVYYTTDASGLATQCSASIHMSAINFLNPKIAFECPQKTLGGMIQLSLERLIVINPDIIISNNSEFVNNVYSNPQWASINAVKNKKIFLTPQNPINFLDRPPSFIRILGVEWLASKIYPQQFKKNIVDETISFYKLYLRRNLTKEEAMKICNHSPT